MSHLAAALRILKPNHNFKVVNGTQLLWEDDRLQPTEAEIQVKIAEIQTAEPMRQLRIQRNQLLQQTDWRMTTDYPYADQTQWATYRTQLRDLPSTAEPTLDENGNLTNVVWPTPPSDL